MTFSTKNTKIIGNQKKLFDHSHPDADVSIYWLFLPILGIFAQPLISLIPYLNQMGQILQNLVSLLLFALYFTILRTAIIKTLTKQILQLTEEKEKILEKNSNLTSELLVHLSKKYLNEKQEEKIKQAPKI